MLNWARKIHREPRWCCGIDRPIPLNFSSSEVLESHVSQTHGDTFTRTQTASILLRNSSHMTRKEAVCPFRCSYNTAEDTTVNDPSPNLAELHKRSLPEHSLQGSRKRQKWRIIVDPKVAGRSDLPASRLTTPGIQAAANKRPC